MGILHIYLTHIACCLRWRSVGQIHYYLIAPFDFAQGTTGIYQDKSYFLQILINPGTIAILFFDHFKVYVTENYCRRFRRC